MPKSPLTGARIRRRRLDLGQKQVDLARICGISASYLNLIEHDRRSIGGKLLADIASALKVAPETLSAGSDPGDLTALRSAAARIGGELEPSVELDRVEEFETRFPGWAGLVALQASRVDSLERQVAILSDRARRDPAFAASLHNILSTVTAIRATSGILAGDDPVEPVWQARFHRNLYEESRRLAEAAEALADDLETGEGIDATGPLDALDAWVGDGSVLQPIEQGADSAVMGAAEAGLADGPALELARAEVKRRSADAALLPLAALEDALGEGLPDPFQLADRFDLRLGPILRRLGALPGANAGLAIADGEGTLLFRRQLPGFPIPGYGAAPALWPLYAALARPGRPETARLGPEDRPWERFRLWAVAEADGDEGVMGTLLILPEIGFRAGALPEARQNPRSNPGPADGRERLSS
ncbi:MAG: helix-turn-helix transcriptional regulator [Pseudomonadota bacterium]